MTSTTPPLNALADDDDELGWDRAKHGLFEEQAADDDSVSCVPWSPDMGGDF